MVFNGFFKWIFEGICFNGDVFSMVFGCFFSLFHCFVHVFYSPFQNMRWWPCELFFFKISNDMEKSMSMWCFEKI